MKQTVTFFLFFLTVALSAQTPNFAASKVLFDHPAGNYIFLGYPYIPFDYNSDGVIDFIGKGSSEQFLSKGLGDDEFMQIDIYQGYDPNPLKVMDFDNDGDMDVVMENYINLYAEVDSFTAFEFGLPFMETILDANDVTGDGHNDLLVVKNNGVFEPDSLLIYVNDGNNSFTIQTIYGHKLIRAAQAKDIDNDGDLDIILFFGLSTDYNLAVLINDNNQFTPYTIDNDDVYGAKTLEVFDFDGDGDLDILVANKIFINSDNFQTPAQIINIPFQGETIISKVADINKDGSPDVVGLVQNTTTDDFAVYVATNQGMSFNAIQLVEQFVGGSTLNTPIGDYVANNLVIFDYNKDGKEDIIFTHGYGPAKGILYMENTTIVGTKDLEHVSLHLSVFPNPATDFLTVESSSNLENRKIQISNQNGKVVLNSILKGNTIDIQFLPKGNYYLSFPDFVNPNVLKFVKQ